MSLPATLNFLKYDIVSSDDPAALVGVDCVINNARELPSTDVDEIGFTKINHQTEMVFEDYWDKNKVIDVVYKECGRIPIEQFNADMTITYQARVRTDDPDKKLVSIRGANMIFDKVHSDFTPVTDENSRSMLRAYLGCHPRIGKDNIRHHAYFNYLKEHLDFHISTSEQCPSLDGDLHEMIDNASISVYQFWRNIGPKTMRTQLALADSRTVDMESRVENRFNVSIPGLSVFKHEYNHFRYFKNSELTEIYNPPQFYYYPELSRDELIIFKGWDSEMYHSGKPQWTVPHVGFTTPNGSNLPSRWSIDCRCWTIRFN